MSALRSRRVRALALLLLVVALGIAGCGRRGRPIRAYERQPAKVVSEPQNAPATTEPAGDEDETEEKQP
jgi:hypothetical protein